MSVQLNEEKEGKLLVIRVSGKLVKEDYEHFVPEFDRLILKFGKLNLLLDMTDFHGWTASALWEDTKFGVKHYHDISKLAMIGDKAWQHGLATFCKPFTQAEVRYFDRSEAAEARKWLMGS